MIYLDLSKSFKSISLAIYFALRCKCYTNMVKQKVALVLSTGGAWGIAHIGVIEELERQGYEITSVSGCSMGALVGAAYVTGKLQECKDYLLTLNIRKILGLMDFSFWGEGVIKGDKIMRKLGEIVPDVNIEDLSIPYSAIATNIRNNQEVIFNHGSLHCAVRASISLPLLFSPFRKDDMILVDGGISNPLPLNKVSRCEGDLLLAVIARTSKNNIPDIENQSRKYSKLSILIEASAVMVQKQIQATINSYQPDIIIRVQNSDYNIFQFNKSAEFIKAGQIAAQKAISDYLNNQKTV